MLGFGGKIKGASNPIGVAVSAKDVCIAQAVSNGYVFEREPLANDVAITDPNFHTETQRAISAALRRGKFTGRQSVSALPAELLRYKTLRLPPMPEEDMAQAVAWEAAERFQLTENQSLQHYRAGQVNQGNEKREEIILLAAENSGVHDHALALKHAGLQPIAIDATAAALSRLLGNEQATLTIHLGQSVAEIIGHRGEQVIFDKPIDLVRKDNVIDATALAREISLCMRYLSVTFGVHKPDATWLAGQGATGVFAEQLSEGLQTTVKTADQSPTLSNLQLPSDNPAQYCVAIGLASRNQKGSAKRGAA
ncbi:MAG: type IV pilus biogenesis protein PilM [Phycisphaeraceae bacterium]